MWHYLVWEPEGDYVSYWYDGHSPSEGYWLIPGTQIDEVDHD